MPSDTIGSNVVIGSGAGMVADITSNIVAVGNTCRAVRPITNKDKPRY